MKFIFMPDNLKKTGKGDDIRININQAHEIVYWCGDLGITPEKLKEAVRKVGPMVKDVKKYLGK